MDRSYKIYKSYHTSHHNTTKTHLQISTPPSSVQQRTDAHNLPNKHIESQASKLQASSNAPTFTTSLQTTRNLKLPNYKRPATRRRSQPPRQTTRKLSLSSQPSSAALMAHPTPGNPLNPPSLINPTLPPEAPHSHHYLPPGIEQPGRRVPVGYDSAGGELILGWRKSALFLKSPLSERQQAASSDFLKTVLAEFRQPRSSPRRSPEPTGTRLPGVRHPPSALHPPPQKKSAPQPIQTTKNALLIPSAYNHTQSPTISIQ